jgi:hypothetical protein
MATEQRASVSVRKYVIVGTIVGILAGFAEALITAIEAGDYWGTAWLHYSQVGFAGWAFGAVGGYIVAKRVATRRDGRRMRRQSQGLCIRCGYNLKGNVSGCCPECGEPVT